MKDAYSKQTETLFDILKILLGRLTRPICLYCVAVVSIIFLLLRCVFLSDACVLSLDLIVSICRYLYLATLLFNHSILFAAYLLHTCHLVVHGHRRY
jgi:hypothetical protein